MQPYIQRSSEEMECGTETFYNPPIMFPTRPKWDHSLSRTKLEQQEQRYFQVLLCVEIWASLKSFPQCISLEFPSKIFENSSQKVHQGNVVGDFAHCIIEYVTYAGHLNNAQVSGSRAAFYRANCIFYFAYLLTVRIVNSCLRFI